MRALVCTALTGIDALAVSHTWPEPVMRAGQVTIAVAAAGLNFPDLLMLSGAYQHKPEPPFVPGMEGAGTITHVASDVDPTLIGRRVMFNARGAFAERVAVDAAELASMPEAWTIEEAAAFPVAAKTAYHALVHRAGLQTGETLVVHGASGGTGHMAIKIGHALGARVIATTGDLAKGDRLRQFGADDVLDSRTTDLGDRLKAASGGRGVDVVFDPIGGAVFDASLKGSAFGARLLIIGFVAEAPNQVRTNYALIKGLSILGVRAGEAARRDPRIAADYASALPKLAVAADLRPHLHASYALENASAAFSTMRERDVIGKLVIKP
jgi:NADPH:quinone reductase